MSMPVFDDRYFETLDRPVKTRACDCPGCKEIGDYRAPKTRELKDYYFFCLDHVRAYNAAWDYYAGLSVDEIEKHVRSATVWDRPTWPMGEWRTREKNLRDQVMREFFSDTTTDIPPAPPMPQFERDALTGLELIPRVAFRGFKPQSRLLVKKYHPDANGGDVAAEEKFKSINQAFSVLRKLYETEDTE